MTKPTSETWFSELRSLAELPWFDLDRGRLRLDPAVGPVIDVHCHLALTYLLPSTVDQGRRTEPVLTYLPEQGRAIDLEGYGNRNLTPEDLRAMRCDLAFGSFIGRRGMRQTHTAANLLARMDDLQISRSVIHAVDFPLVSRNSERYLEVARRRPRLIPFGSSHPRAPAAPWRLRRLARRGIRGLKAHPPIQGFSPDAPQAMRLYRACRELGLPVFWHCGPVGIEPRSARRYAQVRGYERPIAAFPEVTFVLGHSGALQYDQAISLARRYPNVLLDLSCQGLEAVREIIDRVDHDRIFFGSDWPFYHQALGVARVLIATEGDEPLRRRLLHDNAARWLGRSRVGAD